MPVAIPILIVVAGLVLLAVTSKPIEAKQLPPATPVTCSPEEMSFLKDVLVAVEKGSANSAIMQKALAIAQRCSAGTGAVQALAFAIDKQRQESAEAIDAAVPELISSPDRAAEPIPTDEKGAPLWFMDTRGGMRMAIPNFRAVLVTFEGLQRAINSVGGKIKVDGRIGPNTLDSFDVLASAKGYQRLPNTVEKLAANATKWAEVLSKGYEPAQVGELNHSTPIPGVDPVAWADFMGAMKHVGHPSYLGIWRIDPKRLSLLGADPKKFPTDARSQARLFVKDMQARAKEILQSDLKEMIDAPYSIGEPMITLSGLLALVKQAGVKGARSWLINPDERASYPNTTAAFERANEIF